MKTAATSENIIKTNLVGRVVDSKIATDKVDVLMGLLIKNYNNAPMAVLREYVSNAWDSHKLAGQNRPVEVTLPTEFNPVLKVQDWGTGMSLEDILNVFVNLAASTKSHDNQHIGGFGIGSKSALAIGEQFTVRTVKNKLLNILVMNRSVEGIQSQFAVENQFVNEPNGATITIPVDNPQSFQSNKITSVITGWSKKDMVFLGAEQNNKQLDSRIVDTWVKLPHGYVNPKLFGAVGDFASLVGHSGTALVGPVAYPVALNCNISVWLRHNMALALPIGSISFPSSREFIALSDPQNAKVVDEYADSLIQEIESYFNNLVHNVFTLKEAFQLQCSLAARLFRTNVQLDGRIIPSIIPIGSDASKDMVFKMKHDASGRSRSKIRLEIDKRSVDAELLVRAGCNLVINDTGTNRDKVRELIHETKIYAPNDSLNFNKPLVVVAENPSEYVRALATDVHKLSDLIQTVKQAKATVPQNTASRSKTQSLGMDARKVKIRGKGIRRDEVPLSEIASILTEHNALNDIVVLHDGDDNDAHFYHHWKILSQFFKTAPIVIIVPKRAKTIDKYVEYFPGAKTAATFGNEGLIGLVVEHFNKMDEESKIMLKIILRLPITVIMSLRSLVEYHAFAKHVTNKELLERFKKVYSQHSAFIHLISHAFWFELLRNKLQIGPFARVFGMLSLINTWEMRQPYNMSVIADYFNSEADKIMSLFEDPES